MGLCFQVEEGASKFHLAADKREAALAALKTLDAESTLAALKALSIESVNGLRSAPLGYCKPGDTLDAIGLEDALACWCWGYTELDEDSNIVGFEEPPEKISGQEHKLWAALAPFVTSGSVLQCVGEDDSRWRWVFEDGEFEEVQAEVKIIWPDTADGGLDASAAEMIRATAKERYADPSDNNIEIDPEAPLSAGDEGAFVQAWLWVDYADAGVYYVSEDDEDDEDDDE